MAQHVNDDPAAFFSAVVPGRSLGGNSVPFEDPVTEFTAHRENAAEEARVDEPFQFEYSGGARGLSCTTPCFTPLRSARRYNSYASSVLRAVGFSQ